jgi:hypothetical protein
VILNNTLIWGNPGNRYDKKKNDKNYYFVKNIEEMAVRNEEYVAV